MRGERSEPRPTAAQRRAAPVAIGHAARAASIVLSLAACAPLQDAPAAAQEPATAGAGTAAIVVPALDERQVERAYPGARTYSGVLSCAGCASSRFTVTIFADGNFRLRDEALDADRDGAHRASIVTDHGRWHTLPEAANRIVLEGSEGTRVFERAAPDGLTILDHEGRALRGLENATLVRSASVDTLSGPMQLSGHYGFDGRQRVFIECTGGRRIPVVAAPPRGAANPAQAALDAAWQGLQPRPDETVLVVVQGYLVPRPDPRAGTHDEALIVAGFERATRNGLCAPRSSGTP